MIFELMSDKARVTTYRTQPELRHGSIRPGSQTHSADAAPESRIHSYGYRHSHAGDWRQHGDFLGRQYRPAEAFAVSRSGPDCRPDEQLTARELPRGIGPEIQRLAGADAGTGFAVSAATAGD